MKTIGKYQVAEEIGRSAAGVTCRARDPFRNREYVLKILSPLAALSAESKEQLYRDLAVAWELTHRHIAKVRDIGELEGILYIATELLPGSSLMSFLSAGSTIPEKLTLVAQACEALACAHSRGIAHGNLKPGNIFVTDTGYATVLDFGTGTWQALLIASGVRLNGLVPNYLAPEQILGEPFDGRSDIFAVGVMLYEILAGQYPFQAAPGVIPREIVHAQPESLRKWNSQIPEDLEEIVFHAIKKDPRERFQSADEFAASLYHVAQRIREEPPAPGPEVIAPPPAEITVAEQPSVETVDAAQVEVSLAVSEPAVVAADVAAIAEAVAPEPTVAQVIVQPDAVQLNSEQLSAPQPAVPPVSTPVEPESAPAAFTAEPAAQPVTAIPPQQPAVAAPVARVPEAPANVSPAPARQQVRPALPKSQGPRKRRLVTFAMGGLMALSMIGVIVVRQNMAAPGASNPPEAPAAPPVQAPSPVPEAVKPAPFEPTPQRPVQPPPVAPAPEQTAADQILRGQVRPLWEAGQYAEAMRVVDEVLATSPANAEARAWKKKIRAAQEAEADIK